MTTTHVKSTEVEERWFLYDAALYPLGRMATKIAMNLMGKDLPTWTPSERSNTHVVVINSAKAVLSGKKGEEKIYKHYTGYIGGLKEIPIEKVREKRPADIVMLAVRRMLPKTRLGHDILRHLKVYGGADHPHSAQQPVLVEKI